MMEKIKGLRLDVSLGAIITIIVGLILIIWPAESITLIARTIGVIVLVSGCILVIASLASGVNVFGAVIAAIVAVVGLWILLKPATFAAIIPVAIGVVMLFHGIQDFVLSIKGLKAHAPKAWGPFLLSLVCIILGVLCIANAFGVVSFAFSLIGIMLLFDGVSDLFIVGKVNKAEKNIIDATNYSEEDI